MKNKEKKMESGIATAETASREFLGSKSGRAAAETASREPAETLASQEQEEASASQEGRATSGEEKDGASERISAIESTFGKFPTTMRLLCETDGFKVGEKMEIFMAGVSGFARGGGKRYEDIDAALHKLFSIGLAGVEKGFTLDMLETMMKGISYDRMLAEEIHAAEVRGRNANIEARMQMATATDGVPHIESRSGNSGKTNRGIFSLAEGAR